MNFGNVNPLGIISLVGSVLVIVGVFMNWLATDLLDYSITGWTLWTDWTGVLNVKYTFLPLMDLIIGVAVIALMLMPTFVNLEQFKRINNILGILTVLMAVAIIVVSVLFISQDVEIDLIITKIVIHIANHLKIGFWVTMIGASLIIVGGFMPLVRNKFVITIARRDG